MTTRGVLLQLTSCVLIVSGCLGMTRGLETTRTKIRNPCVVTWTVLVTESLTNYVGSLVSSGRSLRPTIRASSFGSQTRSGVTVGVRHMGVREKWGGGCGTSGVSRQGEESTMGRTPVIHRRPRSSPVKSYLLEPFR